VRVADCSGRRSGLLYLSTGVGTATMKKLASLRSSASLVKTMSLFLNASGPNSLLGSIPFCKDFTVFCLISKPITEKYFANSNASGSPT